jgi:hypothetical protein
MDSLELRLGEVQTRFFGGGGGAEDATETVVNSANAPVRSGRIRNNIVDELSLVKGRKKRERTRDLEKSSKHKKGKEGGEIERDGETEAVNNHGLHGLGKDKRMLRMKTKNKNGDSIFSYKRAQNKKQKNNHGLHG